MTLTQSGAKSTANVYGNYSDVGGDLINLVVHGNVTLDPEQAHQRKSAQNTPEDTIHLIREVANLVHNNTANTILKDIATMLSVLQKHTKSRDSLSTLTRSCRDICAVLALTARGASMGRASGPYWDAFSALQSSIDALTSSVREEAPNRSPIWRLFYAGLDVEYISAWAAGLDSVFTSFSAKLNIVTVLSLEHIYELLQQPNVFSLIPDPPPPPPAIFFGREELLLDVKAALLLDKDVALIGPGGIGKSTLAAAVVNDEDVVRHYRRRFFVTYAGIDPKTITFDSFVDRIASILGLPMSGAEGERQIKANFSLSPVLLVLDNAEVFEDAADRHTAARISDFISCITNTCDVTVILTSRTNSNPRRVDWVRFDVTPLGREPARQSFREIYKGEISDDEVDMLLTAVDFHPLSITVLAYTAIENRWSGKVLLERWESQRGKILQVGDGKDNLGFTIKLSLESPSVTALGNNALHVLWVVAFFPQGIQVNQDYLTRLFPSVPHILSIMDTFFKVSLIHSSGPFLTSLAPIRLFVLDRDTYSTGGLELLREARQMYYRILDAISEGKDSPTVLISDHLNIESLIAFDFAHPQTNVQDTITACRQFLCGLRYHKPRPTLLARIITSLPEETDVEKGSKAECLDALGELYLELSNYLSASEASSAAQRLFVAVGNYTKAARCASTAALSYITRGHFLQARQLLDNFIRSSVWKHVDKERKAKVYYTFDVSRMHLSSKYVCKLFLRSMDVESRCLQSFVRHWQARMHHEDTTPEEVQERIEPYQSACMSSPDIWNRWRFLETAAEAAFLQRKFDLAMHLLHQAHASINGSFRLSVNILICRAAIASDQGYYGLSRSLSQRCVDTLGVVATASSTKFLHVLYVQGRNELYAGNYRAAHQSFREVITQCDVCGEIRTKAFCMRALGEAEILLGRKASSNKYFVQTTVVCRESGTPPALLGVCNPMLKLDDDKFLGWKKFLAAHPPWGPRSMNDSQYRNFSHLIPTVRSVTY